MSDSKLTPEQEEVWDKLTHIPKNSFFNNYDLSSMYPWQADVILGIAKTGEVITISAGRNTGKSRIARK